MFNITKILEYIDEQDWITLGLESFLILYLTILWVIFLSAIIYAIYLFSVVRADKKLLQNHSYVTILKPCYGLNPNLEHNLESFFLLDYPKSKYEIRFCISNPSDPAVDVCQKLKEKYSANVKCSIHVDNTDVGINPKINNMFTAWKKAVDNKSDFIFISDSNNYAGISKIVKKKIPQFRYFYTICLRFSPKHCSLLCTELQRILTRHLFMECLFANRVRKSHLVNL